MNLLFPVQPRRAQLEEYPWHQLWAPARKLSERPCRKWGRYPETGNGVKTSCQPCSNGCKELQWLTTDDTLPQGHKRVSFMDLALDFESHAGRPLPPSPQSRFVGTEMSPQEKGRVVRLAVILLERAAGKGCPPAGGDHHTLPIAGAAWGGHGCGGEGTSPLHPAYGGVASLEAPTEVHFQAMGATATIKGGAAAPEAEARPGADIQRTGQGPATAGAVPGQRRGKKSGKGLRQRLLCGPSPAGGDPHRITVPS